MMNMLAAADNRDGERGSVVIRRALEAVRKHLGMEVAYVSEFVGDQSVFREVDAPGLEALIKPGDSRSLDDVYCRHILTGALPELMADTADYALAQSLPITRAVPIGAHMSVPLRLPDGRTYGMFCCLSPHPNRTLNPRDLQVMRAFADMAAHQIGQDLDAERARLDVAAAVEDIVVRSLFRIVYQPIYGLNPLQVAGFEALCRFTGEAHRSPDQWFNEAAAAGKGPELELAVFRRALEAIATLPATMAISLNLSPATIVSGGLEEALAGHPLERVILEITEHAEVADYEVLQAALRNLRSAGLRLAIDDAGAGYSSLQHILQLNPDIIKLDMSLTRAVDKDVGRRALAAALGYFARETGCEIVAEGIETAAELRTLQQLRVAKGQGYFLGRPAPLADAIGQAGALVTAAD